METLDKIYFSDGQDLKSLPILSVGVELNGLEKQIKFQYDMYETYRKLEMNLKKHPTVDLRIFQCISCKYGLTSKDLYQNMLQLREKTGKVNGQRYSIR